MFSKKIFSMLLEKAKGPRSWRQFAADCDISYVQMRKLVQGEQENPPRPKLIRKLADHAFDDVDLEDFMFAAGMARGEQAYVARESGKQDGFYSKYRSLSQKDKNTVNEFVDFLCARSSPASGSEKQ